MARLVDENGTAGVIVVETVRQNVRFALKSSKLVTTKAPTERTMTNIIPAFGMDPSL